MKRITTPRGFHVCVDGNPDTDRLLVDGLSDIALGYMNGNTTSVEDELAIFEMCVKVAKATGFSLGKQIETGTPLPVEGLGFVKAALEYVKTGERRLPVEAWAMLLPADSEKRVAVSYNDHILLKEGFGDVINMKTTTLFNRWVANKGGLQDLVLTLYCFYSTGNDQSPVFVSK